MFYRLAIVFFVILIEIILTKDQICKPIDCQDKIKDCPYGYRKLNDCKMCHTFNLNMTSGVNQRANETFVVRCSPLKKLTRQSSKMFENKEICVQPKIVGFCRAAISRFFYNNHTEKCEEFLYGGCGGNKNNFQTIDQCKKICINKE